MAEQFLVPQFIDVEDKIIGPVTVRQFVILIIAVVVSAIAYKLLAFIFFLPLCILLIGVAAVVAFVKVNGRPLHYFLLNFAQTMNRPGRRIWNKAAYVSGVKIVKSEIQADEKVSITKERLSGTKLENLSLIINTGGLYRSEEDIMNDNVPQDDL
jgi:hypothetical protein